MAEIYKNIKTGVKAELIEINEKSKQVTLKKLADGKPTSTLMGSFEKYWKKIDGDATAEKKPAKTEPKKEAEKPVKEPVKAEEVKKEEPKAEKAKKEKAEKPKKERVKKSEVNIEARKALIEKLSKTYPAIKIDDNYFSLKIGDKIAFAGAFGANDVRVCAISAVLPSNVSFKTRKNALNAVIRVTYEGSDEIFTLIKYAEDNFKDSDVLKKKRRGKKKAEKVEKSEKKTKKSEKVEMEEK